MFKVNSRSTRRCSGVFIVIFEYFWHVVLVGFFFFFFFSDFEHERVDGILYCLNLNFSVHFTVWYSSPVLYKTALQQPTTVSRRSRGDSRPKLHPTFGCCPQFIFFENLFHQKQCKYAVNIGMAQIRGALLQFFLGKKCPFTGYCLQFLK